MKRFNPAAATLGLGDVTLPTVPKPTTPTTLPIVPTPTPTAPKTGGFWNTLDKILGAGQKGAEIYDSVKNNSGSGPVYTSPTTGGNTSLPGGNIPQPDQGMSTGAKVAIGAGIAAVVGTGIYLATKPEKKSLGCPGEPTTKPAVEPTASLNGPRRKKRKK